MIFTVKVVAGVFAILLFGLALALFRASARARRRKGARAGLVLPFGAYLAGCVVFLAGTAAMLVAVTH